MSAGAQPPLAMAAAPLPPCPGAASVIRAADTASQPWKNGGGVTQELLAWPQREGWVVRLSLADITQDGPFSAFPGVQRWFVVLHGAGVRLAFADGVRVQRRGDVALQFDGAAAPGCELIDGPTQDLNLMLQGASGGLWPAHSGQAWAPQGQACGLFTTVLGFCHVANQPPITLAAHSLLWFDVAPAHLRFEAEAAADATDAAAGWWIAATPQRASEVKP